MQREYDRQGKYFHHVVKLAGWTEKRVMGYLIKKFKKTHFNALDAREKREAISTMKFYADKNQQKRERKMRTQQLEIFDIIEQDDIEILFESFKDEMNKLHSRQDKMWTLGNCHDWWKSRWHEYWRFQNSGRKAIERFEMVWRKYNDMSNEKKTSKNKQGHALLAGVGGSASLTDNEIANQIEMEDEEDVLWSDVEDEIDGLPYPEVDETLFAIESNFPPSDLTEEQWNRERS
jgi:hypothetical protein